VFPGNTFINVFSGTLLGGLRDAAYSNNAIGVLAKGGGVTNYGSTSTGGDTPDDLPADLIALASTLDGFAGLTSAGQVVCWGAAPLESEFDDVANDLTSGVTALYSTRNHFAALKGTDLIVWGSDSGTSDTIANVAQVFEATSAFAYLTGANELGHWPVESGDITAPSIGSDENVTEVYSTGDAFAALIGDRLEVFGNPNNGGQLGSSTDVSANVSEVFSNERAFAALMADGHLELWGEPNSGGSANDSELLDVDEVFNTDTAFVALRGDDTLYAWGMAATGGTLPSGLTTASSIVSTCCAFAAIDNFRVVAVWGNEDLGGTYPSALLSTSDTVTQVEGSDEFFMVLNAQGEVVVWGGDVEPETFTDVSADSIEVAGSQFVAVSECYSDAPTSAPTLLPTREPTVHDGDDGDSFELTPEWIANHPIAQYIAMGVGGVLLLTILWCCCCSKSKDEADEDRVFMENMRGRSARAGQGGEGFQMQRV